MIIAYNLCYSTCLGEVPVSPKQQENRKMGCSSYPLPAGLLASIGADNIFVAPNNVMFVKRNVKEGVLPMMLREILQTRGKFKDS
jgi:DNA polymerase zeta